MTLIVVPAADSQLDVVTFGVPVANAINDINDRVTTLETNGVWVNYGSLATILSATVTPPTMGNSTLQFASYILLGPKTCKAQGKFTIGSTFSAGSGVYRILLPLNADTVRFDATVGCGLVNDSGTALRGCTTRLATATTFDMLVDATNAQLNNTGSGTAWGTSDWISWDVTYALA